MGNVKVVISHCGMGWDISAFDDDGQIVKTAFGMNGSSAYCKADILANYYKTDNGQRADIIWADALDSCGNVVPA